MTLAQKVGEMVVANETKKASLEFGKLAKFIMSHKGSLSEAAADIEISSRQVGPKLGAILTAGGLGNLSRDTLHKAAVAAGSLSSNSALVDYGNISAGFIGSLANVGVFDSLLPAMTPLPLGTGVAAVVTTAAQGYSLSEGTCKPISRLSFASRTITPQKVAAVLTETDELAKSALPGAEQKIQHDLGLAVSIIVDAKVLDTLITGATPVPATGTTASAARTDISNLLESVGLGTGSKPYFITTSVLAKNLTCMSAATGPEFPGMTPLGGTLFGVPTLIADGCPSGDIILIDASGVGGAAGEMMFRTIRDGDLHAESAPDSPATASTVRIPLWQNNLAAVLCERYFACVKLRSDAAGVITGAAYSA